jgi:FdrA protein
MIDPSWRNARFRAEAADPAVGVLVLDVVLGFAAHPDPAGELAPLIAEALADRRDSLTVVVSVCAAAADPQNPEEQVADLLEAGAIVTRGAARAGRVALAAAGIGPGSNSGGYGP